MREASKSQDHDVLTSPKGVGWTVVLGTIALLTICRRADRDPATLSLHVFAEGAQFSWTARSPSKVMLGRGTAETELKARAVSICGALVRAGKLIRFRDIPL